MVINCGTELIMKLIIISKPSLIPIGISLGQYQIRALSFLGKKNISYFRTIVRKSSIVNAGQQFVRVQSIQYEIQCVL
jgi:hypothetical protein